MESALPVLTALLGFGVAIAAALWANRRFRLSAAAPSHTEREKRWVGEIGELSDRRLCLRQPYC